MDVSALKKHPRFGSYAAIGAACGVSREAVRKWKRIPPERCIALERHTAGELTRFTLRPDVFGQAPDGTHDHPTTREAA